MENPYKQALEAAQNELAELLNQHTLIERRIAKLRQTVATLGALSEPDEEDEQVHVPGPLELATRHAASVSLLFGKNMALSDAVREVLKSTGRPMTSVQVRDGLIRMGIDIEQKYTSPLAVIHKALKRLDEKKEVRQGPDKDGKTTYQWLANPPYTSSRALAAYIEQAGQTKKQNKAASGIKPRSEGTDSYGIERPSKRNKALEEALDKKD